MSDKIEKFRTKIINFRRDKTFMREAFELVMSVVYRNESLPTEGFIVGVPKNYEDFVKNVETCILTLGLVGKIDNQDVLMAIIQCSTLYAGYDIERFRKFFSHLEFYDDHAYKLCLQEFENSSKEDFRPQIAIFEYIVINQRFRHLGLGFVIQQEVAKELKSQGIQLILGEISVFPKFNEPSFALNIMKMGKNIIGKRDMRNIIASNDKSGIFWIIDGWYIGDKKPLKIETARISL